MARRDPYRHRPGRRVRLSRPALPQPVADRARSSPAPAGTARPSSGSGRLTARHLRALTMRPKQPIRWCAVYTRKSSEEGLEQEFNSLDAQREAGKAYIKSQQHEGWRLLTTHYDDGGYSGGTLDRPALQRLLDRHPRRQGPDRGRLQGRPPDPLARRLRQADRAVRRARRLVRLGHPAVQHHDLDGSPDAERAAVLRPVRARGHRRAHPRQDRRLQEEGHVDGRHAAPRLRREGPQARRQRSRGRAGAAHIPAVCGARHGREADGGLGGRRPSHKALHQHERSKLRRPGLQPRPSLSHPVQSHLSRRDRPQGRRVPGRTSGHCRSRPMGSGPGLARRQSPCRSAPTSASPRPLFSRA